MKKQIKNVNNIPKMLGILFMIFIAYTVFVNMNNRIEPFTPMGKYVDSVTRIFNNDSQFANKPYNPKYDRYYLKYYEGYFGKSTSDPYDAYCNLSSINSNFCSGIGKSACPYECRHVKYDPNYNNEYLESYRKHFGKSTSDPYFAYCNLGALNPNFCSGIGKSACRDECR